MIKPNLFASTVALLFLFLVTPLKASEDAGVVYYSPSMSPSGAEVVFSSNVGGSTKLWIVATAGQSLRALTTGLGVDDEPAWSPDGLTIAFTRRLNNAKDIWTIQRDGTQLRQLTSRTLNSFQSAWAPDSSRLAFVSDRAGTNDIWLMNADGTNQTRATSLLSEESEPCFSPSGGEIAFSQTISGGSSLSVVTLATGAVRVLTATGFHDWHPSWSAAGIIFSSDRLPTSASGNKTIWIVQSDRTGLKQFSTVMALDPSWTSSGKVVFTDEVNTGVAAAAISLLNPTGGLAPTQLLPASFTGDLNGDGIIDLKDVAIIQRALNTAANRPYDARDRNNDGKIDALDVRLLTTQCRYERCASSPP